MGKKKADNPAEATEAAAELPGKKEKKVRTFAYKTRHGMWACTLCTAHSERGAQQAHAASFETALQSAIALCRCAL
jgi:hypothetical protein